MSKINQPSTESSREKSNDFKIDQKNLAALKNAFDKSIEKGNITKEDKEEILSLIEGFEKKNKSKLFVGLLATTILLTLDTDLSLYLTKAIFGQLAQTSLLERLLKDE